MVMRVELYGICKESLMYMFAVTLVYPETSICPRELLLEGGIEL